MASRRKISGISPSEIRRSVPPRVRFFAEHHLGTWGIPLNQIRGSTDSESPRTPRITGAARPHDERQRERRRRVDQERAPLMCGIVGYAGNGNAVPILMDGLRRLEYRGYDSAGIGVIVDGRLEVRRSVGKIAALERVLAREPLKAQVGVAHTRWATHG